MAKNTVKLLTFLFHTIAVLHHVAVFYCLQRLDFTSTNNYVKNAKKFSFRFFTMWNFTLQCVYFSACIVDDVLQLTSSGVQTNLQGRILKFKNYIFRTFVFPLSFTVAFMFWALFLVDRKFVFPPEIDQVMPAWVNHAMHTNIVIVALLELSTTFHWYPKARNHAITGITIYIIVYGACYLSTYLLNGIWLYPVYDVMNWTQRIIFSLFTYVITIGFYFFGEGLNAKIWETEIQNSFQRRKVKGK